MLHLYVPDGNIWTYFFNCRKATIMTSGNFDEIAKILKEYAIENGESAERRSIARAFAEKLAKTNPKFNKEQFIQAAGISAADIG